MPIYCYETAGGAIVERKYPIGGAPKRIRVKKSDGTRVSANRCLAVEIAGQFANVVGTNNPVNNRRKYWPLKCVSSGVHPDQAQELRNHYKKHGLNIHVDKEGDPHYEDASQRKKALKCRSQYDRNSFS